MTGKFTTNVLATSYFRSDAELKALLALTDGFGVFDSERLAEIFAKRDANGDVIPNEYVDGYVPLTSAELTALAEIPCMIIDRDFFQDYSYAFDNGAPEKATEFYNPQTLKTNHWLHFWGVFSTSPYANAIVFTQTAQAVSSITVTPSTATLDSGVVKLSATVVTTGFANKAVTWSSSDTSGKVSVDSNGVVTVASGATAGNYTITATSVFDSSVTGTATITVPSAS